MLKNFSKSAILAVNSIDEELAIGGENYALQGFWKNRVKSIFIRHGLYALAV